MAIDSQPITNLEALRKQTVGTKGAAGSPPVTEPFMPDFGEGGTGFIPSPDVIRGPVIEQSKPGGAMPSPTGPDALIPPSPAGTKPNGSPTMPGFPDPVQPPQPGITSAPSVPGAPGSSAGTKPQPGPTMPGFPDPNQPPQPSGVPTWDTSTGNPGNASPPASPGAVDVGGGNFDPGANWNPNIGNQPSPASGMSPGDFMPVEWEVTDEQTVAGQFASIMSSSNPAFQVIQEQVRRAQAASGRQNSAMSDRGVVMALAEVGFQMAAADAATFARSAEFNAAMGNQFGLAEQAFFHNSMLSEQNFNQGVMMLREQHAATISQIQADLQSRLAQIGATATAEIQIANNAQANNLALMDRAHGQNLEAAEVNFQYGWQLNEQGQGFALEQIMANANAQGSLSGQQFGYQMQLNYLSEIGANGRQLLSTIEGIGGNPNITADQASAAIADAIRNYNAVNQQLSSVYGVPLAGGSGSVPAPPGGQPGPAPQPPPGSKNMAVPGAAGGGAKPGAQPGMPAPGTYNSPAYNYMQFTPRTPNPTPIIPFYGGGYHPAPGAMPSPGGVPGGQPGQPAPGQPVPPGGAPPIGGVQPIPVPAPTPGSSPNSQTPGTPLYPTGNMPGVPGQQFPMDPGNRPGASYQPPGSGDAFLPNFGEGAPPPNQPLPPGANAGTGQLGQWASNLTAPIRNALTGMFNLFNGGNSEGGGSNGGFQWQQALDVITEFIPGMQGDFYDSETGQWNNPVTAWVQGALGPLGFVMDWLVGRGDVQPEALVPQEGENPQQHAERVIEMARLLENDPQAQATQDYLNEVYNNAPQMNQMQRSNLARHLQYINDMTNSGEFAQEFGRRAEAWTQQMIDRRGTAER